MTATDANGSTWYALATEADFLPGRALDGTPDPTGPALGAGVSYDPDRHVLELTAEPPRRRLRRLPGLAVDPTGERYLVVGGRLVVERCDGSLEPLPCEPGILRDPGGLALDRRGLLYVADRAAHRVVVLQPDDGRVEARLEATGMREPVDVAVAPSGEVLVADRGGGDLLGLEPGRIWRFGADFEPRGSWVPRDGAQPPRPSRPRPIAVLWDGGDVLVADEAHPRLLAFDAAGDPRRERELRAMGIAFGERFGHGTPDESWYARGARAAIALGAGCDAEHGPDAGRMLAEVHAGVRVLRLAVSARFRACGHWTSAVLDAGVHATSWHRIDLDVELPAGASVGISTATSDERDRLADVRDAPDASFEPGCPPPVPPDPLRPQPVWDVLRDRDGAVLRFSGATVSDPPALRYDAAATAARVREQLVQSPPGRYLRVRVDLHGAGIATPSVRALRILHRRRSYRHDLPAVWSKDPGMSGFLDGYLSLFERVLTRIEGARDDFYRLLRPAAAPPAVLAWLGALLDLSFDPSWPLARRRALVAEACDLYRRRGTPAGIVRYVEIYAGIRPVITEAFRERPDRAAKAGSAVLGSSFGIGLGQATAAPPDEELFRAYAHRFTVHLPLPDACDRDRIVPVVERIVATCKPAHTSHELRIVAADARLDVQSTVGVDLIAGARPVRGTRLGPGDDAPILGQDTVLGPRRPFPRHPDHEL